MKITGASFAALLLTSLSSITTLVFAGGEPEEAKQSLGIDSAIVSVAIDRWITEYNEIKQENHNLRATVAHLLNRVEALELNRHNVVDPYFNEIAPRVDREIKNLQSRMESAEKVTEKINSLFSPGG